MNLLRRQQPLVRCFLRFRSLFETSHNIDGQYAEVVDVYVSHNRCHSTLLLAAICQSRFHFIFLLLPFLLQCELGFCLCLAFALIFFCHLSTFPFRSLFISGSTANKFVVLSRSTQEYIALLNDDITLPGISHSKASTNIIESFRCQ